MKKLFITLMTLGVFITSIVILTKEEEKYDPQDYYNLKSVNYYIFEQSYSRLLFYYGNMAQELSKIESEDDLDYVLGTVDSFLTYNSTNIIFQIAQLDVYNDIVKPDIQENLLQVVKSLHTYTSDLQALLENQDLEQIKSRKEEFEKVYELERELNTKGYQNEENISRYNQHLESMLDIVGH